MTPEQAAAINALRAVAFLPGTGAKRFARDLAARLATERAGGEPYVLSDKQVKYLEDVRHTYRRQIIEPCPCPPCIELRKFVARRNNR